jgi:xanthine dehydrogenase accessory factor
MQDILPQLDEWLSADQPCALATVIETWGSAPRGVGSVMAIRDDMQVAGSVSGGCIEGAVIEEALQVIASDEPREHGYGVSHETAWSVGLTCGGKVRVLIEKHPAQGGDAEVEIWDHLKTALVANRPKVLMTRLDPEQHSYLLVDPTDGVVGDWQNLTEPAVEAARAAYIQRQSKVVEIAGERVFVRVFARRDQLLIVGAAHITVHLVALAAEIGFETTVIDPRQVFATPERFPVPPDHLSSEWPGDSLPDYDLNEDTYAVLLTHDPKIDDPALHILLRSPVSYIGAIGSRKTQDARNSRLQEAGFTAAEIDRISGPAGLRLGGRAPAEIALSIIAQIVQTKYGHNSSPSK